MEWNGYAGAGLWVDLSTGMVRKEPLDPELAHRFLGGWGFTNKLAYDLIKPNVNPLSPENVVVIGSGALSGTLAPASTKVMATTKLPINGAIGTPFGGGFSHRLKGAGYDYMVITGRADRPVYLKIMDEDVTLEDGEEIWGRDTYETTEHLWAKHGADSSVIAIGQAGENQVRIAFALVDKFGTLGRGGLGAVFGSKNLKAVVVNGTRGVRVADPEGFIEAANTVRENTLRYAFRSEWLKLGPGIGWLVLGKLGSPSRNWTETLAGDSRPADVIKTLLKIFRSGHACPSCPLNCRALVGLGERDHAGLTAPTNAAQASVWFANRYEGCDVGTSVECLDRCNRYGLDAFATMNVIDYAIDLYRSGILTREDVDGEEPNWDMATVRSLLEKICRREGLGNTLAEGEIPTAKRFGDQAVERVVGVKGLGPFFDPRGHLSGVELAQAVNPRGSYAVPGITPAFTPGRTPGQIAKYCHKLGVPEQAIDRICHSETEFDLARLIKWSEDWYSVYSCLGVCARQPVTLSYTPDTAARLYTTATGIEITPEGLHQAGERAWNLVKAANVREGFDRKDDKFPDRFFEPLKSGDKEIRLMNYNRTRELTRDDVEKMFDDYYDERGWDVEKGIPTREKLEELDLKDVADDLEEGGFL